MDSAAGRPSAQQLETRRLILEPLGPGHADEMIVVLGAPELYRYTGGEPPTLDELRARYERQAAGRSPDGNETWLNWVVRLRSDHAPVGYVQASITNDSAEIAWVIGLEHQGRGYATEAAGAMVSWLRGEQVSGLSAHIHPEHRASQRVAERLGLSPTERVLDGEVRWSSVSRQAGGG